MSADRTGRDLTRSGAGGVRGPGGAGTGTAARSPFVLLIVVLLAGGLISLLLLNAAVNQDSFTLSNLQKETSQLTDEEQALQQEVDGYSAPGALDRRARELGMVPGGNPAFLTPDGTVRGDPGKVTAAPVPTPTVVPASPTVAPSGSAAATLAPVAATPDGAVSAAVAASPQASPEATPRTAR